MRTFTLALLFGLILAFSWSATPVLAQTDTPVCGGEGRYFLGIPSWDRGLGDCENIEGDDLIAGERNKILINNLAAIGTHVAAILTVLLVILAGFRFILSSGNPEQAASARKALINAAIGLVIVVVARVITEIIYNTLTG